MHQDSVSAGGDASNKETRCGSLDTDSSPPSLQNASSSQNPKCFTVQLNIMDAVCECLKSSNDTVVSADLVINLASDHDRLRAHERFGNSFEFNDSKRITVRKLTITEVDMTKDSWRKSFTLIRGSWGSRTKQR